MTTHRFAHIAGISALAMATAVDGVTAPAAAPTKKETIIEGMDSRRMFDTPEDAAAYLNSCSEKFSDFESATQVINGVDAEGNFDKSVYTSDMRVMVAVLANRGEKGKPSTLKALVVTPAPTIDSIIADAGGKAWLDKIIDKELNHVAVRQLRTADDVETVKDQMPLTLGDYISSSRESTGGIMETYNTLFKGLIASVGAKSVAWAKARLTKNEMKKAMESTAYAKEFYPTLEDRGDKPSLFVMAMQLGQREAAKQGLDPAIFAKWQETRNAKALPTNDEEESDDFDLDSLAFVEEKPEATAAAAESEPAPAA